MHPVFHVNLLRPYYDSMSDFPSRDAVTRPLPDLNDQGEDEFEVEKMTGKELRTKGRLRVPHYFVKWKGYPNSDNTWEPYDNFRGTAEEAISAFEAASGGETSV